MDDSLQIAVEKLRLVAEQPGHNVEQLAVQAGVSVATLYRLLRRRGSGVRYTTAQAVIELASSLPDRKQVA